MIIVLKLVIVIKKLVVVELLKLKHQKKDNINIKLLSTAH